ncbi:DUF6283 family protein [Gordonia alkaliphila]|uniref:DUF6283 family protein n=1 Tax=Gordonia alkaliphila TaxID=1053547 RepID=UPI003558173C
MSALPSDEFFSLRRPCGNCPFRTDVEFPLTRAASIADELRKKNVFLCHKTVDYSGDDGGNQDRARMCAGARATAANDGIIVAAEQVATRLGLPVPDTDPDLPVYDSLENWVESKRT